MNAALAAAEIQARCARMLAQIAGMQAANQQRLAAGEAIAYSEYAFFDLADDFGLGKDDVDRLIFEARPR